MGNIGGAGGMGVPGPGRLRAFLVRGGSVVRRLLGVDVASGGASGCGAAPDGSIHVVFAMTCLEALLFRTSFSAVVWSIIRLILARSSWTKSGIDPSRRTKSAGVVHVRPTAAKTSPTCSITRVQK